MKGGTLTPNTARDKIQIRDEQVQLHCKKSAPGKVSVPPKLIPVSLFLLSCGWDTSHITRLPQALDLKVAIYTPGWREAL